MLNKLLSWFRPKPKPKRTLYITHVTRMQKSIVYLNVLWITFSDDFVFINGSYEGGLALVVDKKNGEPLEYHRENVNYIDEIVQEGKRTIKIDCAFDNDTWELRGVTWTKPAEVFTSKSVIPPELGFKIYKT